mmetsp:Transcript_6569/g.7415  ORF Transcript_6569/g.7415 Transcript_6569/m.7415 type:complete len:225 (-) Transcript_6569:21-695(-)
MTSTMIWLLQASLRSCKARCHCAAFSQALAVAAKDTTLGSNEEFGKESSTCRAHCHCAAFSHALTAAFSTMLSGTNDHRFNKSRMLKASCHRLPSAHALMAALNKITSACKLSPMQEWKRRRHCCHSALVLRAPISVVQVMLFGRIWCFHRKNDCSANCQDLPLSHALIALVKVMTSRRICVYCSSAKICKDSTHCRFRAQVLMARFHSESSAHENVMEIATGH